VDKLSGGEAKVLQSDGFHIPQASPGQEQPAQFSYRDQGHAKISSMKRVNLRDLQNQIEGEFHLFFRGNVIRGDSFYTDIPLDSHRQLRIAHMLKINPIDKEKYLHIIEVAKQFKKLTISPPEVQCSSKKYEKITQFFSHTTSTEEQCIAAMLNVGTEGEPTPDLNPLQGESQHPDPSVDVEALDCDLTKLQTIAIDDQGQEVSGDGLTDWLEEEYVSDIIESEKKAGATHEQAVASTSQLIIDTANSAITHPPDPPVLDSSGHDEIKEHLSQLVSLDYSGKL
jgi:hypothetical protein